MLVLPRSVAPHDYSPATDVCEGGCRATSPTTTSRASPHPDETCDDRFRVSAQAHAGDRSVFTCQGAEHALICPVFLGSVAWEWDGVLLGVGPCRFQSRVGRGWFWSCCIRSRWLVIWAGLGRGDRVGFGSGAAGAEFGKDHVGTGLTARGPPRAEQINAGNAGARGIWAHGTEPPGLSLLGPTREWPGGCTAMDYPLAATGGAVRIFEVMVRSRNGTTIQPKLTSSQVAEARPTWLAPAGRHRAIPASRFRWVGG
jgi:hypothetical protein